MKNVLNATEFSNIIMKVQLLLNLYNKIDSITIKNQLQQKFNCNKESIATKIQLQ